MEQQTATPQTETQATPAPNTTGSLVRKLAQIVSEIDHVEKRGENKFHGYKYVRAADLAHSVRKKMAEHKIILLSDVISREETRYESAKGETYLFTNIQVRYTFYDGESNESLSFVMPGAGADKGDKGIYKAITGSLKYALRNAFLVPDDSDPEADAGVDKAFAKQEAAKIAAAKTAVRPTPINQSQNLAPKLQASIDIIKERTKQICEYHLNGKAAYMRFSAATQARVGDALREAKAIFDKHLNCYVFSQEHSGALIEMMKENGIECFPCDAQWKRMSA